MCNLRHLRIDLLVALNLWNPLEVCLLLSVFQLIHLLPILLLLPWELGDRSLDPTADIRPVVLVVGSPVGSTEGFDAAGAVQRILDGTANRLRARGVPVQVGRQGKILVATETSGDVGGARMRAIDRRFVASGKPVTLAVNFATGANRWASGSETRFGGDGDAAWRLAAQLQRNVVRGLWDVLAYDSYDRGIVEESSGESEAADRPAGVDESDPWVVSYPLFVTNPRERSLLEWPDTLDLLSSALANAVYDYLDPTKYTPQRSSKLGWRYSEPWQPVVPGTFYKAEHSSKIALTFDGGASSAPTPAILKALKDAGVRATLFLTADFVDQNPELVVQMAKDGHEFGNHSSTHPDMTKLSAAAILAELDRLENSVKALTGKSTRPWFRPPYGASDGRLERVVAEHGYYTIMWTADSADWRDDVSPATVQNRLLAYASPGSILIEHLGSPQSAQVLPEVLWLIKERGLSFGMLSEVLGTS